MEGPPDPEIKKESPLKLKSIPLLILLFLWLGPSWLKASQDDLLQLRAAIHVSSKISDGSLSLSEIARSAQEEGIEVVVFSDRDLMLWEYGLRPLENLIKKRIENNSIFTFGIKEYLQQIEELKQEYPGMVFIAGTESAPFYYWRGSPFKDDLTMHNWHKHILAVGLDEVKDYKDLPVIGNRPGLKKAFSPVLLWPFLTLLVGIFCARRKKYRYRDKAGRNLGPASLGWRIIGLGIIVVSLLFIINNRPFFSMRFDQYHGDQAELAYQDFIDYVNKRGALSFWLDPEAEYNARVNNIQLTTAKRVEDLKKTKDYTGFSIFPAGYKEVGKPGGVWDELLLDYCRAERDKPVWAMAGLGFEKGDLRLKLKSLQTVVLAAERTDRSVIEAMRQGRMYVAKGKDSLKFSLDKFYVCDDSCSLSGTIGDTVEIEEKAFLHLEGSFSGPTDARFLVKVIKNGQIVKRSSLQAPFLISYYDPSPAPGISYYRLEISSPGLRLVTNPIFVVKK